MTRYDAVQLIDKLFDMAVAYDNKALDLFDDVNVMEDCICGELWWSSCEVKCEQWEQCCGCKYNRIKEE